MLTNQKDGPFERLEKGQIDLKAFAEDFEKFARENNVTIDGSKFAEELNNVRIRPAFMEAVEQIKRKKVIVGVITNNWSTSFSHRMEELSKHFDFFIESYKVGMRKPQPEIYQLAQKKVEELLGEKIDPSELVFLDDLGVNLKSASKLGWNTIRVANPSISLLILQNYLGIPLFTQESHSKYAKFNSNL